MNEEGLFRISAPRTLIDSLRTDLDRGVDVDLSKLEPHTVAGILKQWLKFLPFPLLLSKAEMDSYNAWISIANQTSDKIIIEHIIQLMQTLPESNQHIAKCLCKFLNKVTKHEKSNKMNASNMAVVFSPLLLHPHHDIDRFQMSLMRSTSLLDHLKKLLEVLISSFSVVFAYLPKKQKI